MNKLALLTITGMALVGHWAHGQNLIQNGSFESPTIASNTYQRTTPTSWTWGSTILYVFNGNGGASYPLPFQGQQYADIGNAGVGSFTLSQTFSVTNERIYVLRWFDNTGAGESSYSVTVLRGAATVTATNVTASQAAAWRARAMRVTLSPGIHTLRFSTVAGFYDALLDDVSLEPLPDDDLVATIRVSTVDICWRGRVDEMYQVQYRTNLSASAWTDLGAPIAGNGSNCVTDAVSAPQRNYRVIRAQ